MKKIIYKLLGVLLFCTASILTNAQINAQLLGRYSIGTYNSNGGVAEISAYDPGSKRMFVINGPDSSVKIVSIANPASPVLIATVSVKPYGIDVTSVACNKNGVFALAVIDSNGKTNPSNIVFLDINGNYINKVKAGANADHVIFTSNGQKLLVANEGEPNVGYTIDPEGSISIIDLASGVANITQANVQTAGFTAFNSPAVIDSKIRIFGKIQTGTTFLRNSTVAEDLEPEYIAISDDNTTAWVTCQENNALAVVNINTATVTSLLPLGYKNHRLVGNGLDPSDRDNGSNGALAKIDTFPVFGMFLPDGISHFKAGNQSYLVTANEGDARADWGTANNEENRVGDAAYVLDSTKFGGAAGVAAIKANSYLGRLTVSNRTGDFNNDGKIDSIFCFGARSFSIWNGTTGALVWDSKDEIEQKVKSMFPANFNTGHTTNALDDRSDNKGPEPESVTIGKILDSTYAFIGLERIGGIVIYNITNPTAPYFVQYINTRNFSVTPNQTNLASVGDLGPEGIVFIPRNESPNGKDMIMLSNEVSGTVALFQINSRSAFQMQVLHASDMESGIDAPIDAPNFAAVLDTLEGTYANTVKLASGDCYIPSPFLSAGEDPSMQTPLRNTASSYFSGTTSGLRAAIGRTDIAMMNIMGFQGSAFGNHEFDLGTPEVNSIIGVDIRSNGADKRWIGAQFPYLSANLNFSNDINLSYLTTNQRLSVDSFKTSPAITANSQKKGIAPSAIIEMNGEKVGIVGATTQVLAAISSPGATTVLSGGSDNMPALAAVLQPVIDSLRAMGINKIIVMSHLQQLANEKALAPLLKGVDIIIAGGSHSLCADGNDRLRAGIPVSDRYPILTVNNDNEPLAILNTTAEWKYVGRFVCDFDSLGVLLTNLLDSNINGAYAADTAMVTSLYGTYAAGFTVESKGANVRTLTSAIATVINNKDGNKFGKSNVFLEGRRNLVRTEETNFGNLSSDANLWYARQYDNQVKVSIKNGGGIRSAIGNVNAVGTTTLLEKTLANPSAGKLSGDISQLDIENSLRFNNGLTVGTTNAAGLKRILEHGISATKPGATPGQFPQVGGVSFSYDTTKVVGSKIQSMVIIDSLGNKMDTIVRNGKLVGDTSRAIKFVTLDFLYTGGDSYPFLANSNNRVNLDTAIKTTGVATFTLTGKEQDAFAEFMASNYNSNPYNLRDTTLKGDKRIQLLNARLDGIIVLNASATSSQTPYLTPLANGVQFTSLLTAGDVINGYKMAGTPDGAGAYDNNNGTFTMLISHEFGNTVGAVRAHGAKGAFVSKWVIDKNNLSVVSGADLIQRVNLYTPGIGYTLYNSTDTTAKKTFNRFCSSDLPAVSAFYNATTSLGTQERIFMNGEEAGAEGRAFGHIVTGTNAGTTYELPALGKFSWENSVANPATGNKTVVAGTDDATPGQVYIYIGDKTNSGTEVDKAGLTNGNLYGVAVNGLTSEVSASFPTANTNFSLVSLGNVKDSTGTSLNTRSNTLGVTNFLRPEDASWDPKNASDLYFVTTNGFGSPSRLWKLHFNNLNDLTLGGTVTALLDGTEGQQMLDNLTLDNFGHVFLQEDVGNNVHNGKIWQYTIANDKLELLAQHDTTRFIASAANYLTQDEESSGIIDVQNILGAGNFLLVDQAHYAVGGDQVEGGQILKMFNPTTANSFLGAGISSSQSPYLTPLANGVQFTSILTAGDLTNGYKMAGTPDGSGAYDNNNGTFTMLISHEFGNTVGAVRAHGAKGAFVSKWVIDKNNLSVVSGADLIQRVNLYSPGVGYTLYNSTDTTSKKAFNRFCSSDLPAVSAFYNATTSLGTQERIFMNGEEAGAEGRAFGHIVTGTNAGTTYELPALGKFSWENSVANPATGNKTIVAGTDDATPGQVYIYIGDKTNSGTEVDKAGLTNGNLYGIAVNGLTTEVSASFPTANTNFSLVSLGNVKDSTGTSLNTRSNTLGVTNFLRPEDASWDPSNASDLYFVTTNGFGSPSRLWRLHFNNLNDLTLGGTVTALLDGTEGQQMLDNLTLDNFGHVFLQEDVGNNVHNGKIWQYTIANDKLELLAQHDTTRFIAGGVNYLTQDEESSGIIDVQNILGKGNFLLVDQAHYAVGGDQVEGGQILKMFNPTTANSKSVITIAEARALTTANDTVRVRGVITRAWGRFIYIQDATGAIGVRQSTGAMVDSITNGGLKEGDSVEVYGAKGEFNNYAQLQLFSGAYSQNSKVVKLATNVQVPAPVLLTVKQMNQSGEQYESKVVRIVGLRTSATAATFAASTNNIVWDGATTGDTTLLRIIAAADTEVEDAPALSIPKGAFIFEGILAQFCSSPTNGCALGYQLYGVRKKDIIEIPLSAFNLVNPVNNSRIVTDSASAANVQVNWTKSKNATLYKWMLTSQAGTFTAPLLTLLSNNAGVDSTLTLTSGSVDAILAGLGIAKGDSVKTKWTVFAYKSSTDSLQASQVFNLTLARSKVVLGAFNLSNPANNTTLVVTPNSTTPVVINWTASANATKYTWKAAILAGNFNNPIASINADNAGADTKLTLTHNAIDGILVANGVAKGDSIKLQWTVYASRSTDSLKAVETFNITLVRGPGVSVNNIDFKNNINVYPNPAQTELFINSNNITGNMNVKLYSITGQLLIEENMEASMTNKINVSNLQDGIYMLSIAGNNGKNATIKVVITH